jgi:hypothetical protein
MCMVDSCESWEFFSDPVESRARKAHLCDECRRVITPGETYFRGSAKGDGRMYTIKRCAHCEVACNWLGENCGGCVQTMALEDIGEHAEEYPEIRFSLMRVWHGGRRDWVVKRGPRAGQLMSIPRMPLSIKRAMEIREQSFTASDAGEQG